MQTPTGYDTHDRYYATRYEQGDRAVYSIDLSLSQVAATLPRPDPNRPTPGNRRVKEKHARDFGKYVREHSDWVAPALLLRAPEIFEFAPEKHIAGTEFGILGVPRLARTDLRILDGQHRILGFHYAVEDIAREIEETRNKLAVARRQENAELERLYSEQLKQLEETRRRFDRERISVQIHIEDDPKEYEQMFVDIADNALGITSAIRARFDDRKVVNRALDDVLGHPLLKDRVDLEQDRVGGPSQFILGAKHVADVIRTVTVGLSGRVGRRQEDELRESELVEGTNNFLDCLMAAFPPLEKVVDGSMTPEELRKTSLLGSSTMIRVLAGAYHDLVRDYSDQEIQDYFETLAPFTTAPVTKTSPLFVTGVFSEGASAPRARRQDLEELSGFIVRWASNSPTWLKQA